MVFDLVSGSLAAFALLFPLYDSCNRLHAGCKAMKSFGRDVQLLWKELDVQWVRLQLIMQWDNSRVQNPPDPDDPHHHVTAAITEELVILETHFRDCESLVLQQFSRCFFRLFPLRSCKICWYEQTLTWWRVGRTGITPDDLKEQNNSELPTLSSGTILAETTEAHTLGSLSHTLSHASTAKATASEDKHRPNTDNREQKTLFWKRFTSRWSKGRKKSESKDANDNVQNAADQNKLSGKTIKKNQSRQPVTTTTASGDHCEPLRRSKLLILELQSPVVQQGGEASRQTHE